jgi:hypothetical protein
MSERGFEVVPLSPSRMLTIDLLNGMGASRSSMG